ncbi:unnamed protein product [Lactuca virosa]|uniref:ABC-2 type transporter domain-containing protein n=1 Tax=Lactuca virosa TaxID=75947 RepID=A0AAU9PJ02_9ASTR|nr:unnamed protein product [Lactuca virosa]
MRKQVGSFDFSFPNSWTIFSFYFRFLRDRLLCWVLPNVFLWLYTIGIWGQSTYEDATLDVAGCFSFALMMPML